MSKKRVPFTKKNIVDYWKNNEVKKKIQPNWKDAENHCWACGIKSNTLERSHVIPEVLGGPMELSNFSLLCRKCNAQNPETIYEEDFWKWVEGRARVSYLDYCPSGYSKKAIFEEHEIIYGKNIQYMLNLSELHFGYENVMRLFRKYMKSNKGNYFYRYPATLAVNFEKFLDYNCKIIGDYLSDKNDKNVLSLFDLEFPKSETNRR